MSFAGNVVDTFNEDMPFSSLGQSKVNFSSGKDGAKTKGAGDNGYINKTPEDLPETEVAQDQISKDIKPGQVAKDGVEMEGVEGKVVPAAILDKVENMDSLKGLKPEQLMTVQKALGIKTDGKFGPETMGAMQKYFDNANRAPLDLNLQKPNPVTPKPNAVYDDRMMRPDLGYQEGGFISKLMKQGRAY